MKLTDFTWDEFSQLSMPEKVECFKREDDGFPSHTLFAQQFDRETLDRLCNLATKIRKIAKKRDGMLFLNSLLAHKRAMLYFSQPSSRTFLSFYSACQIMGLKVAEVRDAATSSEFKGESKEDSIRTFSSYFDLIIMRTQEKGLAEHMAWTLSNSERPLPIINAGSGKDQHPTQALLDIYTLKRSFEDNGGLKNRSIMYVGDLLRGRTVRSLSNLLMNYENIEHIFVAPPELQIKQDILDMLAANGSKYSVLTDMRERLADVDAVYMTRIQDEWDKSKGESARIDISSYKIGKKEMDMMKETAVLLHPLPRRDEISTDCDHDPRAMYWRQMRNGMWIRAALIAATFGLANTILSYDAE